MLISKLLPYGSEIEREDYMFQHNKISIHIAVEVNIWFITNDVQVLPWPAKCPDLNIEENGLPEFYSSSTHWW